MDTNKYADEVNEMKHTMVLDFLITFGNSIVNWGEVVTKMLDPYNSLDIDDIFYECCEQGYISELIDPFTKIHTYQITKEGLKFLQRRTK